MFNSPTSVILKEIQRCQKSTENEIPRLSFQRLVREIVQTMGFEGFRFQGRALSALQVKLYLLHFLFDKV